MNSVTPVSASTAHGSSDAAPNLVGEFIGKYRVVRELGRGGMGTVFEAVHADIGQRLAIKILNGGLSQQPRFVRRFFDEARIVAMVAHPGLVKIFDFNQLPDGTLYIMMEFLEGQSLWDRFCKTRGRDGFPGLQTADALRITRQLASALMAVHGKGIIHRDLKPENVILVSDPDTPSKERAKLLDFGIAQEDDQGQSERRTTAGVVLGTPTYMAPEQCEGHFPLTDRVDVYALGAMLFELLAGEPPFKSDSTSALMRQHMVKPPPPLPPHVADDVASLVHAMLAKQSTSRPSMGEIVERIDQMDAQRPLASGIRRTSTLPRGPAKHRPIIFLLPIIFAVALLGLIAVRVRDHKDNSPTTQPPLTTPSTTNKDAAFHRQNSTAPVVPRENDKPNFDAGTSQSATQNTAKSKPPGRSRGTSRIIFGTKKSNKDRKSR